MINLMRKNQRGLMIFISAVVIISFFWLYNRTDLDKLGKTQIATIYGKAVSTSDYERTSRQLRVAYSMGLYDLVQSLAGRSQSADDQEYVWNDMVLRHAAAQLQIQPGNAEVEKRIQALPAFQTNGQFDPAKYSTFISDTLTPQGYSPAQMEELVRDDLRLARLKELLGATAVTSPADVKEAFSDAFRKRKVSVVRLKREDFAKNIAIEPKEIQERFEKNKTSYQTEEKRVVTYVAFTLPEQEQKLEGKEKVAALQPLSSAAEEFSRQMLERGAKIDEVAGKNKAALKTTAPFAQATPPAEVAGVPTFAEAAFTLTTENPDSDVLQTDAGFYVLHLDRVEPSMPKTLEQATPEITTALQDEKVKAALEARGKELEKSFKESLAAKKTFAEAAAAAGLAVAELAPFAPAEPGDAAQDRSIEMRAATLQPGEVSDLIETPEGGSIAYLQTLEPLEEKLWESRKGELLPRFERSRREVNFAEWLRVQRQQADLRFARQS